MLSRRSNDHLARAKRFAVVRRHNGQAAPPFEKRDERVLAAGLLMDEDDHGRVESGWQAAQHLRYGGKTASGTDQSDDPQALLGSVKRLVHGG
jgi:hypothetical protein